MKLTVGDAAPQFEVQDIHGARLRLPDYSGRLLLLSFYRYAACPLCNVRVHRLVEAYPDLHARGLELVAFFESPRESIVRYVGKQDAPFPIVADPDRATYRDYGVESSWMKFAKGAARLKDLAEASRLGLVKLRPEGDPHLVPADFLIDPSLRIHTAYYGADIGDHLPLEDIKAFLEAATQRA